MFLIMTHSSTAFFLLLVVKTPWKVGKRCLEEMERFQGLLLANISFHFNIVAPIAVLWADRAIEEEEKEGE